MSKEFKGRKLTETKGSSKKSKKVEESADLLSEEDIAEFRKLKKDKEAAKAYELKKSQEMSPEEALAKRNLERVELSYELELGDYVLYGADNIEPKFGKLIGFEPISVWHRQWLHHHSMKGMQRFEGSFEEGTYKQVSGVVDSIKAEWIHRKATAEEAEEAANKPISAYDVMPKRETSNKRPRK